MARRKVPIERGPPPAYRRPPTNPDPPENTPPPIDRNPPTRYPQRAPAKRPPPPRRATRPRAAKSAKKTTRTEWFDLEEDEQTPPAVEEVAGNETPIAAVPLRSVRMSDLFEAIDSTLRDASGEKVSENTPTPPQKSTDASAKGNNPQVIPRLTYPYIEGMCTSDDEEVATEKTPFCTQADEAFELNQTSPLDILTVKIIEKEKVLFLPGTEPVIKNKKGNDGLIVQTGEDRETNMGTGGNVFSPLPDLNTEFVVDLNTDNNPPHDDIVLEPVCLEEQTGMNEDREDSFERWEREQEREDEGEQDIEQEREIEQEVEEEVPEC